MSVPSTWAKAWRRRCMSWSSPTTWRSSEAKYKSDCALDDVKACTGWLKGKGIEGRGRGPLPPPLPPPLPESPLLMAWLPWARMHIGSLAAWQLGNLPGSLLGSLPGSLPARPPGQAACPAACLAACSPARPPTRPCAGPPARLPGRLPKSVPCNSLPPCRLWLGARPPHSPPQQLAGWPAGWPD